MKQKLFLALLVLGAALTGNQVFAQKAKEYKAVIHTSDGTRYSGVLTNANLEGFTIKARNGAMRFFDADTVSEVKIRSKNALNNNMLLGTTAGLAAGGMLYRNQESRGNVTTMVLPVVIVSSIVSGAGVGGFFNSFFAKERFENVSTSYPQIQRKLAAYAVSTDVALENSAIKDLPTVNAKF